MKRNHSLAAIAAGAALIFGSLSASASTAPLNAGKSGRITLKKSALEKQVFLMAPTVVVASSYPILDHMQPLLVKFKRNGSQLGLFEINAQAFYDELSSDKLLQDFKIVAENKNEIQFEWGYGLEFLSNRDLGTYSDAEGMGVSAVQPGERVKPILTSFTAEATAMDDGLEIKQMSRIREQGPAATIDSSIQLEVRLRPYKVNEKFKAKESELKEGIGYFEQFSWKKSDQRQITQAQRWDISPERGPIVYAISKTVPKEYLEATKEGVLYWNRVFGREVIKVETGVDPQEPTRDRRVLVHWAMFDDAGFARASLQADPLTGELIAGNVYMSSGAVAYAGLDLRNQVRKSSKITGYVPAGFSSSRACELDAESKVNIQLGEDPSPEMIQQYAADTVRMIIAHEVGHTLGLRHNFAGSMASEAKNFADLFRMERDYMKGKLPQGAAMSSTVMDYDLNLETAMIGAAIRHRALSYDIEAIKWGYLEPNSKVADLQGKLPFCTDMQAQGGPSLIVGCKRFDSTSTPIIASVGYTKIERENLALNFARRMIMALHPKSPRPALSVEQMVRAMNTPSRLEELAFRALQPAEDLSHSMLKTTQHMQTVIELGKLGWANEDEWKRRNTERLKQEWVAVGGLAGAANSILGTQGDEIPADWLQNQVNEALKDSELQAGTTLEGVAYQLNTEEREAITRMLQAYGKRFADVYLKTAITLLAPGGDSQPEGDESELASKKQSLVINPDMISARDHMELSSLSKGLVLSDKGMEMVAGPQRPVEYPAPRHSVEVRKAALRWLSPKLFGRTGWGIDARKEIREELIARLNLFGLGKAEGADGEEGKKSPAAPTSEDLEQALRKDLTLQGKARELAADELELIKVLDTLDKE